MVFHFISNKYITAFFLNFLFNFLFRFLLSSYEVPGKFLRSSYHVAHKYLNFLFIEIIHKQKISIYVQVNNKDINIVTPYGKNIFRVDDKMAKEFCREDRFYIDFFYKDIDMEHRNLGRFKIKFRVINI